MMIKIIGYKKHNNVYYENTIVKYLGIFSSFVSLLEYLFASHTR